MDDETYECVGCSASFDNDDELATIDGDYYCQECRFYCEMCEDTFIGEYYHCEGYSVICYSCYESNTRYCDRCETNYSDSENFYRVADLDEYQCETCCSENYNYCDNCNDYYEDNCGCDNERRPDSEGVFDYSYKPDPIFHGKDTIPRYFGIELEMEIRDGDIAGAVSTTKEYLGNFVYAKYDSTISSGGHAGFELVSHPATLEYYRSSNMAKCLDTLKSIYTARSWDAKNKQGDSSCGLHIHLNRAMFKGGSHTHRFLYLIYKNSEQFIKLAGRTSDYAKFTDVWQFNEYGKPYISVVKKVSQYNTERYSAVNTNNEHTIELRFFRGTMLFSGVMSALELAHASVEYTRDMNISDVQMGALSWEWFSDYIRVNNGLYPNLYERIGRVDTLPVNSKQEINA